MPVKVGDKTPNFKLKNSQGQTFELNNLIGKKVIVLYFYPKDFTPGCTAEACSFRDKYEDFKEAGAEVIGISSDSSSSHSRFRSKHDLNFILLSDVNKKVEKLYDVPRSLLGLLPGRVTYIIGKDGRVKHIFNSQFNATQHVNEAMKVVKRLR